ncbi:hypothetical protein LCGC14_0746870 [marine sediment metagenome]|uniref:Uncharacterized protein n=1 Tax=marine sediment metagenome TaxID=412755 RepID=A0A0F9SQ44_9ZZZZ
MWIVQAHIDAVRQIKAQESIDLASAMRVGSGNLKKEQSRQIMNQWERQARGNQRSNIVKGMPFMDVAKKFGIPVYVGDKK